MPLRGLERKNAKLDFARKKAELDEFMSLRGDRARASDLANRTVIEAGREVRNRNLLNEGSRDSFIKGNEETTRGLTIKNESDQAGLNMKRGLFDTELALGKRAGEEFDVRLGLQKAQTEDIGARRVLEGKRLDGEILNNELQQVNAGRQTELQGESNRAHNDQLTLEKRIGIHDAISKGQTQRERGQIAFNLKEPELAASIHPSYANTPEQIQALKNVGIAFKDDGSIDRSTLDTKATGFREVTDTTHFKRNGKTLGIPDDMKSFANSLEALSSAYGGKHEKIPGLASPTPGDLETFADRYRTKRAFDGNSEMSESDLLPEHQLELNSGALGFLGRKRRKQ